MFIGIDLVEIPRIAKAVQNPRFLSRIYTPSEQALAELLPTLQRRAEFFAGRFAVKEAAYKAISALYQQQIFPTLDAPDAQRKLPLLIFTEIETRRNDEGLPNLQFYGQTKELLASLPILQSQISLSHTRTLATAIVLLDYPH